MMPKAGFAAGDSVVAQRGLHGPVPDVALADVLAHSLGVAPLRPSETHGFFVPEAPLHRRRVGVVLALDSAGSATSLTAVRKLHPDVAVTAVKETACGQDNTALLASVLTGVPVSQHGVVGASYYSADGVRHSLAPRTAPALADRIGAGGAVFAGSASDQLAALLSPLSAGGRSVTSLSWSGPLGRFVSHVPGTAAVALDRALPNAAAALGLSLKNSVAQLQGAAFALAVPEDMAFLAELELLLGQANAFRAAGSAPAFFGFAVSTLKHFSGSKLAAAARAADVALAAAIKSLETTFGEGEVAWQVVALQQDSVVAHVSEAIAQAEPELQRAATVHGTDLFARTAEACAELNAELWARDLVAVCPVADAGEVLSRIVALDGNGTAGDDTGISFEEVVAFQLVLWLVVALFVGFLVASSLISSIDIPSDSPLLRNLPDIYKNTLSLRELM